MHTHDSGQAGPFLAVRLAQSGLKVALIEREHYGGTCVNDGCIPTKTLVASARTAHVARRAADYGVILGGSVSVDMKAVMARKDRGETQGFMKVLVDAQTERILGASLLGIEGDEIVHSLLDVMAADASYRVVQRAMHIHLTVSELIPTLLGQLAPMPLKEP